MKFIKWKRLLITGIVCLLPILLGVFLWDALPESMAVHFNMYNQPDNFASKGFAVFGIPVMMLLLQIVCCIIFDANEYKHGTRKKFENVVKWIIPALSVVLQTLTFGVNLNWGIDVRKTVAVIVGAIFLVLGNYLPKFDYVKNYNLDTDKAKKINRFIGIETVIMGILIILTVALPPVATIIWLFMLIPYALTGIIYSIKVVRNVHN